MLTFTYHPDYSYDFPDDHRFPMSKFRRLHDNLAGKGILDRVRLVAPEKASIDDLCRVHSRDYVTAIAEGSLDKRALRALRLPWSAHLAHRSFIAANGTLLTARNALQYGLACHMAGGTHHAHAAGGAGFCVFNDMAYTACTLLDSGEVERVLILDTDVHQGDGTARMLADQPGTFTCSLHCAQNYPHPKAQSDLDVPIQAGTDDDGYLDVLSSTLDRLLLTFAPDLVIYDAGADVHIDDALGKLSLSSAGMRERDRLVFERCHDAGAAVASVIGGGYDLDREALVERHAIPFEVAFEIASKLGLRLEKTVA
ncbi:histone deacetylase [Litorivicinus lipolyticus]|uniref:histone deacetylase family protein n=1 Tax=Litorivicinus lipolyticus TaxID=418701 RepID=UPI003B59EF91